MMNVVNIEEYPVGGRVAIRNLLKAYELNGCIGIVKSRLMPLGDGRQAILLQNQPRERQVSIKPENLQFEPRAVDSLSVKEMKFVLEQKEVDMSNMLRGVSKSELCAKVSSAVRTGTANIDDDDDNVDAVALEIGRILGLDAAEKDTMKKAESERELLPFDVNADKLYETSKLNSLSQDPPCLGGVPVNLKIPLDTVYASTVLARPANLGPLKSDVPFHSQEAARLFQGLSEGACCLLWGVNRKEDVLTIRVCEDDASKELKMLISISQKYNVAVGRYCACIGGAWFCDELINHHVQIQALRQRVLHRFFRAHGHLLPAKQQSDVYVVLKENYARRQHWKHLLDASIAAADAALNSNHPDCATALVRVGEALEASGQFAKASLVYKDIRNLLANNTISNSSKYVFKSMIHSYTGTALFRCDKFSAAEDEYFLALKADYEQACLGGSVGPGTKWDVNQDWTAGLWQDIHSKLSEEFVAAGTVDTCNDEKQILGLALIALTGLLSTAGYRQLEKMPTYEHHAGLFAKCALECYKGCHQTAAATAADALARAVEESNSSKDFRLRLSMTLNPQLLLEGDHVVFGSNSRVHKKTANEVLKQWKIAARNFVTNVDGSYSGTSCDNPGCMKWEKLNAEDAKTKIMYCQCQGASYCSLVCQKEHWPIHKKTCCYLKES